MKIYLMRHGEAGLNAPHDDLRVLTENGRIRVESNVNQNRDELANAEAFFSSPILRAKQTAELTRALLARSDPVSEVSWLIHESDPAHAIIQLSNLKVSSVILFSHQPFASRLVELLCDLDAGKITMSTACIVAVDADPVAEGCGSVLWQCS